VGPRRSGKGTIGRVLRALLGKNNVVGPTFSSFAQNFGLQPLIGKLLAIISDARLSGRTDQAVVVERLLSISGEDNITIDRKYQKSWTGKLSVRLMIMTNELPKLTDSSSALAGRYIILTLKNSFYGEEDHTLTAQLLEELPQILNWAIKGWKRLQNRGHFIQPQSSIKITREIENLSSPIKAFIQDRCKIDQNLTVLIDDLFKDWRKWCNDKGYENKSNVQLFGRDLHAAMPGLRSKQCTINSKREREYKGIGLK